MTQTLSVISSDRRQVRCKLHLLLTFAFLVSGPATAQNWQLVWSDEFDGTEVDTTKWSFQIGDGCPDLCGWGNAELEYYRAQNASVAGGLLTITARDESFGGAEYTSARLRTKNKGDWTYGRFEMRARMPLGQGLWPAFWLLSTDEVYGRWAASGEIDVVEYLGHEPDRVFGTIHYGAPSPGNLFTENEFLFEGGSFAEDFHVFAAEWNPGVIRWFVDDSLYATVTEWSSTGAPFPAPFDQDFHILLNLAVGGTLPGAPDSTTVFPQSYEVDYVRVFQTDNLTPTVSISSPADGAPFDPASDVTIEASAADTDGTIMEVQFFQGDAQIGEDGTSPFEVTIPAVSEGCYALTARATDNLGGQAASDTVGIQVGSCVQAPYLMRPVVLPGVVEAENYDIGGQGTAYNDSDPGINNGNVGGNDYRMTEGVDLELTFDNGFGYSIGSIEPGEWVEYLVDVQESGTFTIDVRVAADTPGGALHIEFDGVDKTGAIAIDSTGGNWATVRREGVALEAGIQTLRLAMDSGGFGVNHITFTKEEGGGTTETVVFEDFEDGDASDWSFIGGGSGLVLTDRPAEGNSYFSTSWTGPGGGFYGGFWKNTPNDAQVPVPEDPWLNVWVFHESAGTTVDQYTLEITVREDTDGNGWTSGQEDSERLDIILDADDFNDRWTLISAPISDFLDLGGGNGFFEGFVDEIFIGIAQVSGPSGATVEVDVDYIALTSGGPLPSATPTDSEEASPGIPNSFRLNEIYPNPFRSNVMIAYDLPRPVNVRLDVFDLLGRRIRTIVDRQQPAGRYEVNLSGEGLASGVYLFRLKADRYVQVRTGVRVE